jgi:hypothetical protein
MLRTARSLLVRELSVARSAHEAEVGRELEAIFDN